MSGGSEHPRLEVSGQRDGTGEVHGGRTEQRAHGSDGIQRDLRRIATRRAAAGIEVLYDDRRDLSASVKFTDADLRDLPLRVVIGERSLVAGGAELSRRGESDRRIVALDELGDTLQEEIAALHAS